MNSMEVVMKRSFENISPSEETCDSSNEFKKDANLANDPKRLKRLDSSNEFRNDTDLAMSLYAKINPSNSDMSSEVINTGSYTFSSPQSTSKPQKSDPSPILSSGYDEDGIETDDSVHFLKLLCSSSRKFQILGKKIGKAALLLQEGMKLMREGQELLCSTKNDMPSTNDKSDIASFIQTVLEGKSGKQPLIKTLNY